jgi:lipopolysaccharide transport system ATP-binding protein
MTDIAISVENLSKSYLVGHNAVQSERYTALRDVLSRNARNLARKTRDMFSGRAIVQGDEVEEFWALKDVSFEIKQGDRVGIIGRNGAGKSTLLKILSRITEPTTGRIKIAGRVASLLEVGTGFHPELTGRENVFLNGAILGMGRREIQRKFDEIVAFAEVEKFLDTPVKRYSSGMYVRLAFAVAAHLEPEILVVDEVLAVGDAQFQKKCLGKLEDVGKEGRTVLFVSHNMSAISMLCNKGIFMQNGGVLHKGSSQDVISRYLDDSTINMASFKSNVLTNASINQIGNSILLSVKYNKEYEYKCPCLGFVISDYMGYPICGSNPIIDPDSDKILMKNSGHIKVLIKYPKLLDGRYKLSLWFGDDKEVFFHQRDCLAFDVVSMIDARQLPASAVGSVAPQCEWDFEESI